jgi:TIR domain
MKKHLDFGPVVIEHWFGHDQIGNYDDDSEDEEGAECAVVYPGELPFALSSGCYLIPHEYLRPVTTADLWQRREAIDVQIGTKLLPIAKKDRPSFERRYELLLEFAYVTGVLMDRMYLARFDAKNNRRSSLFISHSSKDKQAAKWLAVDLANVGYRPWLDEWSIKAGESIPTQIGLGIEKCSHVLLLLSKNSVRSNWVEREWQAKYWNEVQANKIMVIPILLEACKIPVLLQTKKYVDYRGDANDAWETLLDALQPLTERRLTKRSTRTRSKRRAG